MTAEKSVLDGVLGSRSQSEKQMPTFIKIRQ